MPVRQRQHPNQHSHLPPSYRLTTHSVMFTTTMPLRELDLRLFDGTVGLPPGCFDVLSLEEMKQEQALIAAQAQAGELEEEEEEQGFGGFGNGF